MKKIHSLRRQGLLIVSLGIGILIGKLGMNVSVIFFLLLIVIWLFSYDIAVENQFGRRNKR
ncbi:hypothetical protein ACYSNR_02090 [Enterococcus sp. LJL128]